MTRIALNRDSYNVVDSKNDISCHSDGDDNIYFNSYGSWLCAIEAKDICYTSSYLEYGIHLGGVHKGHDNSLIQNLFGCNHEIRNDDGEPQCCLIQSVECNPDKDNDKCCSGVCDEKLKRCLPCQIRANGYLQNEAFIDSQKGHVVNVEDDECVRHADETDDTYTSIATLVKSEKSKFPNMFVDFGETQNAVTENVFTYVGNYDAKTTVQFTDAKNNFNYDDFPGKTRRSICVYDVKNATAVAETASEFQLELDISEDTAELCKTMLNDSDIPNIVATIHYPKANCKVKDCNKECQGNGCAKGCDAENCGQKCIGIACALGCTVLRQLRPIAAIFAFTH